MSLVFQNIDPHPPLRPASEYPATAFVAGAEVEFMEEIQTEVLRVFLLAIHRHPY
jgi:hypothetical protein